MHRATALLLLALLVPCTIQLDLTSSARSCRIPNEIQPAAGVCRAPADCPAFQAINDVRDMQHSIGRQSFIRRVLCNDAEELAICCPSNGANYSNPSIDVELPSRFKIGPRFNQQDDFPCGAQTVINKIEDGIVADLLDFPWMALLMYGDAPVFTPACGAVLISNSFVITAAHCLVGKIIQKKGKLKYVRLGEYDLNRDPDYQDGEYQDWSDGIQDIEPLRIIHHPEYVSDSASHHHDIGLIQLIRPVQFSDFIIPICLPKTNDHLTAKNTAFSISGWGRTSLFKDEQGEAMSPVKLKAKLRLFEHRACREIYQGLRLDLGSGQMCAGGREVDSCAGDSGSPLMRYNMREGQWFLAGVVSLGVAKCGTVGRPGIYTNVLEYLGWVKKITQL